MTRSRAARRRGHRRVERRHRFYGPVEETTLELWNRNKSILSTCYFLASCKAFKLLKRQGIGRLIVFVASKNGLAASLDAWAYCTTKASEIHLAHCLALEGAPRGICGNVVTLNTALRGARIWSGEWLDQRALTYQTDKYGPEEYRPRSLLKRLRLPEDIAEANYSTSYETADPANLRVKAEETGRCAAGSS